MHSQPNFKGWRIKLYELEITGAWLDLGTGLVCCKLIHELGVVLQIISEDKPEFILLQSKIQFEDVYETQGDNIIMWREYNPNSGHAIDYAISFQDPMGCQNIWDAITEVRNQFNQQREYGYSNIVGYKDTYNSQVIIGTGIGRIDTETNKEYVFRNEDHSIDRNSVSPSVNSYNDINNNSNSLSHSVTLYGNNIFSSFSYGNNTTELSSLTRSSPSLLPCDLQEDDVLHRIRYKLENVYASQKDCIVTQLLDKDGDYFHELFNKFSDLESKHEEASLAILAEVMRSILLLNEASIIEFLLSKDSIFYQVAGILEYDKELRSRSNYREYLFKQSKQKEVVSLSLYWKSNDVEEIRASINLLFRLKYLRDIMIHPKIDEQCVTALGSMINFTNHEICCEMFKNISYMANVLKAICPDVDISRYETNLQNKIDSPVAAEIGPMPPTTNTTDNSAILSEDNKQEQVPQLVISIVEVDSNPVHGLYFFRELFTMSRSILVEKRQELYYCFYSKLETPFLYVINKLLYDVELYRTTSDPSNAPFLSNQYEITMQIIGEILSSIIIVCPSIVKHSILSHVIPLFNPMSNSASVNNTAVDQMSSPSSTLISGILSISDKENNPNSPNSSGDIWYRSCLLYLIIDQLLNSSDAAAIQSFSDMLKILLELEKTPNSAALKTESNKFLSNFYDYYLSWLLVPFLDDIDLISSIPLSYYTKHKLPIPVSLMITTQNRSGIIASRRNIFEILIQCVQTHSYRFKYFAMRNNIISKIVNKSFYSKDQSWLHLSVIKFLRAILTTKDEFYFKHIEKVDLLKGMFQILKESKHKDNLITSAIHDLIEYIRAENIKLLIVYVVSKYSDCFPEKRYVEVYDKLKIRYEQIVDGKLDSYQQNTNNSNSILFDRNYNSSNNNNVDIDRVHGQFTNHSSRAITEQQIYSSSLMRRNKKFLDSDHEEEYFFGEEDDDDDDNVDNNSYSSRKIRKINENQNSDSTTILDNIVNNAFTQPFKSNTSMIDSDDISISSSNSSNSLSNPLLAMLNIYGNDDDYDNDSSNERNVSITSATINPTLDISETPSIQSLNKEMNYFTSQQNANPLNKTVIDIFAGDDFVKSETSDNIRPISQQQVTNNDTIRPDSDDKCDLINTAEPPVSLPPLKSRFEYDDDDVDMITFDIKSFNNHKTNHNIPFKHRIPSTVQSSIRPSLVSLDNNNSNINSSNSNSSSNINTSNSNTTEQQQNVVNNNNHNSSSNTGTIISFSLKKKQV